MSIWRSGKRISKEIIRNREEARRNRRNKKFDGYLSNEEKRLMLKLSAMERLGGVFCANCGCDKVEILEINHKDGGGQRQTKERGHRGPQPIYREIIKMTNPTEKYNVLCRICNAHHFVETILGIIGHKIIWLSNEK